MEVVGRGLGGTGTAGDLCRGDIVLGVSTLDHDHDLGGVTGLGESGLVEPGLEGPGGVTGLGESGLERPGLGRPGEVDREPLLVGNLPWSEFSDPRYCGQTDLGEQGH